MYDTQDEMLRKLDPCDLDMHRMAQDAVDVTEYGMHFLALGSAHGLLIYNGLSTMAQIGCSYMLEPQRRVEIEVTQGCQSLGGNCLVEKPLYIGSHAVNDEMSWSSLLFPVRRMGAKKLPSSSYGDVYSGSFDFLEVRF
ncbi:hypothetical protein L7F22_054105 [Adiantum nelumboides]|nr:hypothetical protein [Adiantum nelumboides]